MPAAADLEGHPAPRKRPHLRCTAERLSVADPANTKTPPMSPMASPASHRQEAANVSTGIITTAIVLIVGYVIISRVIGLAFRFVVPLVLVAILAGAGVFSNLMPDRGPE